MSTSNQQGNDSGSCIVAAISVLSLFLMLALAIISIIFRVSSTSFHCAMGLVEPLDRPINLAET